MGFIANLFGKTPVADAATLKAAGAKVIDVRSRGEFQSGHISGAKNIDVARSDFASAVGRLNPRHTYVVYCQSGSRSGRAASVMQGAGLTVVNGGGMHKMQSSGWTVGP